MDASHPGAVPVESQACGAVEGQGRAALVGQAREAPVGTAPKQPASRQGHTSWKGGEGVLLMNAARKGYWMETALAYHGRPAPVRMLALFLVYFVVSVAVAMLVHLDEDDKPRICLDSSFAAIAAPALFFLLVFRTNAAYDRWWEGRKHWGMIINRSRDFSRQAVSYIGDDIHVERIVRYTIAFAVATKVHLRMERDLGDLVDMSVLSEAQVLDIHKAKHMPNFVLEVLSQTVASAKATGLLSDIGTLMLDQNLTQYEDELGACERIMKTKMPFAYTVHLRAFLILWLFVLPFCIVEAFEWVAIPACMFSAYALLGLDSIGVDIENPFGHDFNDLPLDDITNNTICKNLLEILERHQSRRRAQQVS